MGRPVFISGDDLVSTDKNILIAFILNLAFSIIEFTGGLFTGSIAIISDAIHDIGDATSIMVSYIMERISKKQPNKKYTYGYLRYSVLGSIITALVLVIGSCIVICNAIMRIYNPIDVDYNGMMIFAVFGVIVNFAAFKVTHGTRSLNQKAVNLHMLEDVLGWVVVLIGAVIIKITGMVVIDPIMSIAVAVFILRHAVKGLIESIEVFLEKVPSNIDIEHLEHHIKSLDGIIDIHHIHIWSIDGCNTYATMHIVTNIDGKEAKRIVREELLEHNIKHATIEIELEGENCDHIRCHINKEEHGHKHHHCGCGHSH